MHYSRRHFREEIFFGEDFIYLYDEFFTPGRMSSRSWGAPGPFGADIVRNAAFALRCKSLTARQTLLDKPSLSEISDLLPCGPGTDRAPEIAMRTLLRRLNWQSVAFSRAAN
jgi:hypothetical protein